MGGKRIKRCAAPQLRVQDVFFGSSEAFGAAEAADGGVDEEEAGVGSES